MGSFLHALRTLVIIPATLVHAQALKVVKFQAIRTLEYRSHINLRLLAYLTRDFSLLVPSYWLPPEVVPSVFILTDIFFVLAAASSLWLTPTPVLVFIKFCALLSPFPVNLTTTWVDILFLLINFLLVKRRLLFFP